MTKVKRNTTQKKADRREAEKRRKPDEHVLNTIDGASLSIEVGSLLPSKSLATSQEHLFQVSRVNEDIDAVYGVIVERCPMPWWKWNIARRKGLVTDEYLVEFNRTSEG